MLEADEEPLEVVLAGLLDLPALDVDVVEEEPLLGDQAIEVEAERGDVRLQLVLGLLEQQGDPGLAEVARAAHEELRPEQRLAAAGAATDERGAPAGEAAARDLVEPTDAGGNLGQGPKPARLALALAGHLTPPATEKRSGSYARSGQDQRRRGGGGGQSFVGSGSQPERVLRR